eukprot:CAMPEP_0115065176 /NCGR_PEP_ID=MMETSP0227-20121206/10106_1 /TAXON_ID=89957 /ORGANISM="Polarella glacialis, Strain CCMP 1383" /LENGTH=342 /DNA_ID=CAMNT_0002450937 /DNA_START=88 /DNA_END=1116 /DNA_ORIENTATION=+
MPCATAIAGNPHQLPGLSQMAQGRLRNGSNWSNCGSLWPMSQDDSVYSCSTAASSPELVPGGNRSPGQSWNQMDFGFHDNWQRQMEDNALAEVEFYLPDAAQQAWSIYSADDFQYEPNKETLASADHLERLVASLFDEDESDEAAAEAPLAESDVGQYAETCDSSSVQGCTTAMLRNLPNKYMRDKLVDRLHACGFHGDIDFLYLPIDFRNKCNVGYCFINFRTDKACQRFKEDFHGMQSSKKLPGFNSKKVLEVSPARVQGLQPNIQRLQGSPVMAQVDGQPEWLPILIDKDGCTVEFPRTAEKVHDEGLVAAAFGNRKVPAVNAASKPGSAVRRRRRCWD